MLAILLGIGGGIALTALAGARRTDGTLAEFVSYSLPDDGGFLIGNLSTPPVTPGTPAPPSTSPRSNSGSWDLPQVAAFSRAPYLYLTTRRQGREASDLTVIGVANQSSPTLDGPPDGLVRPLAQSDTAIRGERQRTGRPG